MDDEKYIVMSGNTKIAGVREKGYVSTAEGHKYILFSDKGVTGSNTEAGFTIIRQLFGDTKSRKQWYKDKTQYNIQWTDNQGKKQLSLPINYRIIAEHLRKNGRFIPADFNLADFQCHWLDGTVNVSINWHRFDKGKEELLKIADGTPAVQFGDDYPIKPQLDREGHFFTSFQPLLVKRIIRNRTAIIDNSDTALHYDWVLDLRTLINDTISLIEITLNQIYIKAKYKPEPDWSFEMDKLGNKNGKRLMDKLKWVRQISGNNLNIESERQSLDSLRQLRNHFNHFDPPSLVVTLEEAAVWLNQIIDIGIILIKIRKTMNLQVSTLLINFILQKEAVFNPEPAFRKRLPIDPRKSGYYSSTWKYGKK